MAEQTTDPVEKARELLDQRVKLVEEFREAVEAQSWLKKDAEREKKEATEKCAEICKAADKRVSESGQQLARRWQAMLDSGWSENELRQMGFTRPDARPPGRPRKATGSRPRKKAPAKKQAPSAGDSKPSAATEEPSPPNPGPASGADPAVIPPAAAPQVPEQIGSASEAVPFSGLGQ